MCFSSIPRLTDRLETKPRQHVRKLVDLFERTSQYLFLVGLACYTHHGLSDPKLEALRPGLALHCVHIFM